jgi:tetratricopeptide (TPR) repeat protein
VIALRVKSLLCVAFALGALASQAATTSTDEGTILKMVDAPAPFCEEAADLSVAADYFVPIGNDLTGLRDYNDLIRTFQKKEWEKLDGKMVVFRKAYESSPLQEAVAFLNVESLFDRIVDQRDEDSTKAEKGLREVLLLYPKSTLAPVLAATAANFWLRRQRFEKSLGLYQTAYELYPLHPLSCVYQMGIIENEFGLRSYKTAQVSLTQLLQKCQNRILRARAEMRLADMALLNEDSTAEAKYEKLFSDYTSLASHYVPEALFNLGELKYRKHQYPKAKFYFTEYRKAKHGSISSCLLNTEKRIADVGLRQGENKQSLIGTYLGVHELSPLSDAGIYSQIHAFLLDLRSVHSAEYDRRLKVIDTDIDKIQDENLRSLAYLEKGLILLDAGEDGALDYLVRLSEKKGFSLKKGPLAAFVRDRFLRVLDGQVQDLEEDSSQLKPGSKEESDALSTIENSYGAWLKGTPYETRGRKVYAKLMLELFGRSIKAEDVPHAIAVLDRWKKSELWNSNEIDTKTRKQIVSSLLATLAKSDKSKSLARDLLDSEASFKPFARKELATVWIISADESGNDVLLKSLATSTDVLKAPISVDSKEPAPVQSYVYLKLGEALAKLKRFKEAEVVLGHVKDPALADRAGEQRQNLYSESKDFARAYDLGVQRLGQAKPEDKKAQLMALYDLVSRGKLWNRAQGLLKLASSIGIEGKDSAPFRYLSAKSLFEKSQCRQAIPELEAALNLDSNARESAEARYHLGQCLIRMKRPAQAKKIWEELAQMKDNFWSGLAQNEIKLLQ